jgi:hypothetical protein
MRGYPELHIEMPVYGSPEYKYNQYLVKHRQKQNKGSGTRDSERQKTYAAENLFMRQVDIPTYDSVEEIRKVSKKIYKSKTWIKLWSKSIEDDVGRIFNSQPEIVVMSNRNKTMSGFTNGRTVTLSPVNGFNKYILLHELAHTLGHMHHGRSFRQCLLSLVGAFMGANEKKILKNEFKRKGLAFGEARQPKTFEQWNEARLRMESMRKKV